MTERVEQENKWVYIETYGCQMNVADSEIIAAQMQLAGYQLTDQIDEADAVLINTCSVRDNAEQRIIRRLDNLNGQRRRSGHPQIVGVLGCMAERVQETLIQDHGVDLVAGPDAYTDLPHLIAAAEAGEPAISIELSKSETYSDVIPVRLPGLHISGFVSIMRGCNNFCTYCIVPFTRGRQKSRDAGAILDECRALIDNGAKEITLLGQNVNSYGLDKHASGDTSFARLLRQVSELPGLARLRFVTPHPKDLSPEVIAMFGEVPNLCPRLHLPLQAGSDRVLARMNRKYDMARYMTLVEGLRAARPDIALSTDLIVGFPGETEEQFQETLDAVRAVNFMSSFSFCYSDRPGTAASRHTDKVEPAEKLRRLERLQALQEDLSSDWLKARVGCETDILLEGASRKQDGEDAATESWQGRDPWGDAVNVSLPAGIGKPGLIVPVAIVTAKKHSLIGELRG